MVYNGVINFNEKAKMDVVDFVNNQNPVSKKINDTNINRLNNYYNNNLQHNRKKKPLNLRLISRKYSNFGCITFQFEKWR